MRHYNDINNKRHIFKNVNNMTLVVYDYNIKNNIIIYINLQFLLNKICHPLILLKYKRISSEFDNISSSIINILSLQSF